MCGLIGLHLVVNLTREIVLSLVFYMLTVLIMITRGLDGYRLKTLIDIS